MACAKKRINKRAIYPVLSWYFLLVHCAFLGDEDDRIGQKFEHRHI